MDYHELISVITAGRLWIMEVFHIVVKTGVIFGGYDYPAAILDAIHQSGIEFLIVYHAASNSMYFSDEPIRTFYGHGGLQADGKTVSQNASLFLFGDATRDSELSDMVVQLSYDEDSRIVNNLVNIACTSGSEQCACGWCLTRSKDQQLIWFDELARWAMSQMSPEHPNKQHIVLLWNVWSNKCASMAEAYAGMARLLRRVNANRQYAFTASSPLILFLIIRLATIDEFSHLLATHHGKLPRRHSTVFPAVHIDDTVPHEVGPYSNKPAVKGHIRHALAALRQIETFFAISSPKPLPATLLYAMQYAREQLAFSTGRYFLGGLAINPTLDEVEGLVTGAAQIVSLSTSQREVSFTLDDTTFDMRHSIFENTVDLGRTESLVVRVVNVQSIHRHAVTSFQVGHMQLCVEEEEGDTPNFQIFKDFENLVWIFLEVDVPPLSEKRYIVRTCNNIEAFLTTQIPFTGDTTTRLGTTDFGVILNSRGEMKYVEIDGKRIEFNSQLAYYHGGTDRRTRTG